MEMLDKLPDNWREQIHKVCTELYAQTTMPPNILTLPWSWLRGFQVQDDSLFLPGDGNINDKYMGMDVAYGFVDHPTCAAYMPMPNIIKFNIKLGDKK